MQKEKRWVMAKCDIKRIFCHFSGSSEHTWVKIKRWKILSVLAHYLIRFYVIWILYTYTWWPSIKLCTIKIAWWRITEKVQKNNFIYFSKNIITVHTWNKIIQAKFLHKIIFFVLRKNISLLNIPSNSTFLIWLSFCQR